MPAFPSQGSSKNSWGTSLINFFSPYFDMATGVFNRVFNNVYSISYYGNNLTTAVASIGSTPRTLIIDTASVCTSNTVVPSTLSIQMVYPGSINQGSYSLTITSAFSAGLYRVFTGSGAVTFGVGSVSEISPYWWGAKVDDSTDDSAAWNAAFASVPITPTNKAGSSIIVPHGISKVTSPIDVPTTRTYIVRGSGNGSVIHAVGCDAFTLQGQGYYQSDFSDFAVWGNNTASKSAFNLTPSTATWVAAGIHFENIRIVDFLIAWNVPDTQLCSFYRIKVDFTTTGGSVFYMNTSGGYGQSNSNRVSELQVGGADAQVFNFTFTYGQNAASNWTLEHSDIQISGTTTPITIKDRGYIIHDCEFENSTANNLILLTADDHFTPNNTSITNNYLAGGGAGGNAKIRSQTTGTQYAYYVTIIGNDAGSSSTPLLDFVSGRTFSIISNQGTIVGNGNGYNFLVGNNSQSNHLGGMQFGSAGNYIVFDSAAPTTQTWSAGDFLFNSAPSELGAGGSKYIILGWSCTVAGTPGTWLQARTLTGN